MKGVIPTTNFRSGLKIEIEGEPFLMIEFQHVKPGKGGAFVRTKLKSLKTGNVLERTFRSGEKVDAPDLEEREMQYLYKAGDHSFFMDTSTYEQIAITEDQLGDSKNYLQENIVVTVLLHNGVPIGVTVPFFVELKVVQTEPGIRGNTATGAVKPATLETGVIVQVPLFINEGEIIKVDTRTGEYIERVK